MEAKILQFMNFNINMTSHYEVLNFILVKLFNPDRQNNFYAIEKIASTFIIMGLHNT